MILDLENYRDKYWILKACWFYIFVYSSAFHVAGAIGIAAGIMGMVRGPLLGDITLGALPFKNASVDDMLAVTNKYSLYILLISLAAFTLGTCGLLMLVTFSNRRRIFAAVHVIVAVAVMYVALMYVIITFASPELMRKEMCEFLHNHFIKRYVGITNKNFPTQVVDYIQEVWHCCGAYDGSDYEKVSWDRKINEASMGYLRLTFPQSCCRQTIPTYEYWYCLNFLNESDYSNYRYGCCDALWERYYRVLKIMAYTCVAIVLFLFFGIQATVFWIGEIKMFRV